MGIVSDIQSKLLMYYPQIVHFVTRRTDDPRDPFKFNMGIKASIWPGQAEQARKKLAASLKIKAGQMYFPVQCHTDHVGIVDSTNGGGAAFDGTDALATKMKNVCLVVQAADCMPILLFDHQRQVVASIHAGWRGTAQNIVPKTIQAMHNKWGTQAENIVAFLGPSICGCCYEVGQEVKQAFLANGFPESIFTNIKKEKPHLDLWKANTFALQQTGVPGPQIEIASVCTYENTQQFFSARREGIETGRFAAGIMIKG
jgi:polyphenol oxidase